MLSPTLRAGSRALSLAVVASLVVACGGGDGGGGSGGGGDGSIDLIGNIATGIGVITGSSGPQGQHNTIFDAAFGENTSVSLPAAGQCSILQTLATGTKSVSAGVVTVTGGNEPMKLTQEANTYAFEDDAHEAWAPGATLTLNVAGSGPVPAMSGSAAAPGRLVVTSPTPSPTPIAVNRKHDFAVTWKPFSPGEVFLAVAGTSASDGHAVDIECRFDGSAGRGAVPTSVLASLGKSLGSLAAESITFATSTAGTWTLLLGVAENATDASGNLANVQLNFE